MVILWNVRIGIKVALIVGIAVTMRVNAAIYSLTNTVI